MRSMRGAPDDRTKSGVIATTELDEGGNDGNASVHWTQQDIHERDPRDIAGHLDEIDRKTQLEQRSIRKDVVCRDRRQLAQARDERASGDAHCDERRIRATKLRFARTTRRRYRSGTTATLQTLRLTLRENCTRTEDTMKISRRSFLKA